MEIRRLLDFLKTAEQLKCNTRHSYTSSGRLESVAEHSWRLALMAMLVGDEFPEMDMDKVIKMCLIHDMGEAITGDIPAFEKTDKDRKVENKKVEQLTDILPEPVRAEWKHKGIHNPFFADVAFLHLELMTLFFKLQILKKLVIRNFFQDIFFTQIIQFFCCMENVVVETFLFSGKRIFFGIVRRFEIFR